MIERLFKPNVDKLKEKKDIEGLIQVLSHKNKNIRSEAALAIGQIGDEKAINRLVNMLSDDCDPYVRISVARAIFLSKNEKNFPSFLKLLTFGSNPVLPSLIERLLKEFDDEIVIRNIIKIISREKESNIRYDAQHFLQNYDDEIVIDNLIKITLDEQNEILRITAIKLFSQLNYQKDTVIRNIVNILSIYQKPGIRDAALNYLKACNDEIVRETLIKITLDEQNETHRCTALRLLSKLNYQNDIEPLIKVLSDDSDSSVRQTAAEILGQINSETIVDPLVKAFSNDPDGVVRSSAIRQLTQINSARFINLLLKGLTDDPDPSVREAAARGLSQIDGDIVVEPLVKALSEDPDTSVRVAAARGLGLINSNTVVEPLVKALSEDPDTSVREVATQGLGQIDKEIVEEILIQSLSKQVNSPYICDSILNNIFNQNSRVQEGTIRILNCLNRSNLQELIPLKDKLKNRYLNIVDSRYEKETKYMGIDTDRLNRYNILSNNYCELIDRLESRVDPELIQHIREKLGKYKKLLEIEKNLKITRENCNHEYLIKPCYSNSNGGTLINLPIKLIGGGQLMYKTHIYRCKKCGHEYTKSGYE